MLYDWRFELILEKYVDLFQLTLSGPWESPITKLVGGTPWVGVADDHISLDRYIKRWNPVVEIFPCKLKGRFAYMLECESNALRKFAMYSLKTPYPLLWTKLEEVGIEEPNKILTYYFQAMISQMKSLSKDPNAEKQAIKLPLAKFGEAPIRALDLD